MCDRLLGFIILGAISLLIFSTLSSIYVAYRVYPEIGMVVKSQCKNPTPSWNGKVMGLQLWKNGFDVTNHSYNTYLDTTADRRLSIVNESFIFSNPQPSHPIIIWGSHHKTGTYLAQKLFAALCSRMRWCCIYHVTRDSIHAIQRTLQTEPVHLLGHTQWIWLPEELGVPYKFFHFYRHPYKKILSGYRYHRAGAEEWCKKPLEYGKSCLLLTAGSGGLTPTTTNNISINVASAYANSGKKKDTYQILSRESVQDFCKSVHLCEPCCRREHELVAIKRLQNLLPGLDDSQEEEIESVGALKSSRKKHKKLKKEKEEQKKAEVHKAKQNPYNYLETMTYHPLGTSRVYAYRNEMEYQFICKHLSQINVSLMDSLLSVPLAEGLRIEAAIDYYESLRMAQILHHTRTDPHTLNIDLDEFMSNYSATVALIVQTLELEVQLSRHTFKVLIDDLQFYDINNSPIYRYSMSNPFLNHVDPHQEEEEGIDLNKILTEDEEIRKLYRPILKIMYPLKDHSDN